MKPLVDVLRRLAAGLEAATGRVAGDNIEKWTKQALLDLELTAEKLLQPAQP